MNSIKGFYPVILIPHSIRQFCADNPIQNLEENATFKIKQPFPPRLPVFNNFRYYLVIQFWIASAVVVMLVNWRFGMSVIAFWSSLVCASISALAAFSYLRFVDFQVRDRYNKRLAEYQKQLVEYESYQLRCLQSKGKESEQYISLLRKRSKLLKRLLKEIVQPPVSQGKKEVQQGVSEKQFFVYLCRYFSGFYDFCMGGEFPIPGTSFCYTADFILVHQPTGLAIDIEIDEPYDGRTGKPHHCVDRNKDNQRNRFFLERNWVVIRFSELQVVKYPDACCKAIARVISQIAGDYRGLAMLQNVVDLLFQKQWTTKEAIYMAKTKFRNSYL
ncbi:MAG TPA: hypothetical protein DDW76_14810 [Cyanobacteria bacterium UBA11369]|nr:hypothetical protein [Cyanobacteria bacterium UBA11371]HBE16319.1 hypothetical protein [Cyanobacteria bacterium UBA11367]HBE36096.1 hypothetical protein [Cyanobacteria bacterium UBA11368]HBE50028.1 hypothetical protein [Cyanobacteria bacterium UBA11369]